MTADGNAPAAAPARRWRIALQRHHLNTAIYLGASVLSKAASIFLIPVYTSRLSKSDYAIYGLAQTLYWIGPPIFTLALSSALGRFFFDHKDEKERDRTVGALAIAMLVFAGTAGLLYELFAATISFDGLGGVDSGSMHFVVWTCVSLALGEIPSVYYRCSEQALRFAALQLTTLALTMGSTLFFMLHLHLGLRGLLAGMLFGQGSAALFAVYFMFRRLIPSIDRHLLREALRFSAPLVPHVVGTSFMLGVDRWALEYYGLRDDLGLYTLATQLTIPVLMAASAWNEASSPRFLAVCRDGGYAAARRALPRVVLGFIATGGGALVAVLLVIPLLRLVVGARFHGALGLVPFIGASLVIGSMFSAFINVLFLRKTTGIIPVLTLLSIVANAALNAVLVPRWGVHGAILATAIALAFRSGIMAVFAMRALKEGDDGASNARVTT